MTDHPNSGSDNDDDGVVRSSGATQQEGYSPLLARLLDETMRDAEREKQNLDETIREKEAAARRKREEEAVARRAEIQRRVEEEQARRQALIAAAQGKPEEVEATSETADVQTETAVVVSKSGGSNLLPWALVLLLAGTSAALFMKFSGEVDALQNERAGIVEQLGGFHGKLENALPDRGKESLDGKAPSAILGVIGVQLDALIEEEKSQRESAAKSGSSNTELEKKLAETEGKLKSAEEKSATLSEENARLTSELEGLMASKAGRKAKRFKKKTPAAPKAKKVNVNTDIFNPNAR